MYYSKMQLFDVAKVTALALNTCDLLQDRQEIDGVACWVIAKQRLMEMKQSANRPQDQEDLMRLKSYEV